jgi:hypothetical protein
MCIIGIGHLAIYIPQSLGGRDCTTRVYYIGLRGECMQEQRQKIVTAVYEARAIPEDHKGLLVLCLQL